jgi:hypothetical protein
MPSKKAVSGLRGRNTISINVFSDPQFPFMLILLLKNACRFFVDGYFLLEEYGVLWKKMGGVITMGKTDKELMVELVCSYIDNWCDLN